MLYKLTKPGFSLLRLWCQTHLDLRNPPFFVFALFVCLCVYLKCITLKMSKLLEYIGKWRRNKRKEMDYFTMEILRFITKLVNLFWIITARIKGRIGFLKYIIWIYIQIMFYKKSELNNIVSLFWNSCENWAYIYTYVLDSSVTFCNNQSKIVKRFF